MVSTQLIGTAIGGVLLAVGLYQGWTGVRNFRRAGAVSDATPLRADTPSGELVAVEGTVRGAADGHTLESRLGGTACVAYSSKKVKQDSYGDASIDRSLGGNYRERISEKTDSIPFVLETDAGPARVDAATARLDLSDDDYSHVSINQVVENKGIVYGLWRLAIGFLTAADKETRRQYLEACLGPGDTVLVVGALDTRTTDGVTVEPGRGSPLVVSSGSQSRIAERFRSTAKGRLYWGAVLLLVTVFALATVTGLI